MMCCYNDACVVIINDMLLLYMICGYNRWYIVIIDIIRRDVLL